MNEVCERSWFSDRDLLGVQPIAILIYFSRQENSQKLTQFSQRSLQRHLLGKRIAHTHTHKENTTEEISSDGQVNSHFPYRWPPASLTLKISFFLIFLFIFNKKNNI